MRRISWIVALVIAASLVVIFACSKKSAAPTAPPPPVCTVSPSSIAFGTVLNGQSRDTTFKLTNTSSGRISGSLSFSCPDFSFVSSNSYDLQPGAVAQFTVRFAPSSPGSRSCSITTDCGSVTLTGNDVTTTCSVSPETLSFGRPTLGQTHSFTVKNTSSSTVSGSASSPCGTFPLVGTTTYQLGRGQSQPIQVSFTPTVAGPQSCTISTGLPGCPTVVATGIGQACNVSPTSLNLGTTWDHIDKTFSITNTDSFPLQGTVTTSCPAATILGPAGYNLAPGAAQTFTVGLVNSGYGPQTCQINAGVGTCSAVTVLDSTANLDSPRGGCAAATEQLVDFGTMSVGQTLTHVLHICGVGQCSPSSEYCYGNILVYSSDLTFDGYSFAAICGNTDCRPLTATFTPHEPGVHHVLVAVYSYTAGYNAVIEGYVEFRARVVP